MELLAEGCERVSALEGPHQGELPAPHAPHARRGRKTKLPWFLEMPHVASSEITLNWAEAPGTDSPGCQAGHAQNLRSAALHGSRGGFLLILLAAVFLEGKGVLQVINKEGRTPCGLG